MECETRSSSLRPVCPFCQSRAKGEFQKILEQEEVGITLYRYRPGVNNDAGSKVTKEIFILQTTKNVVQLNPDTFVRDIAKCRNYCPRCVEMMRRAENLLKNSPTTHKKGVVGLCDHLYKGESFSCPPCGDIVDKFLKLPSEEYKQFQTRPDDLERPHLQQFLKRSKTSVRPLQIENAVESEIALQASEIMQVRKIKDKGKIDHSVEPFSASQEIGMKNLSAHITEKNKKLNKISKEKSASENRNKTMMKQTGESETKSTIKIKRQNRKNKVPQSTEQNEYQKSLSTMRETIAENVKKILELERQELKLRKQKEDFALKALAAEQRLKQESQRVDAEQITLKDLKQKNAAEESRSLDLVPSVAEECADDSGVYNIIRGEKLYKTATDQSERVARDLPSATAAQSLATLWQSPTPTTPSPSQESQGTSVTSSMDLTGVLRYSLSNPSFIEKGWTLMPREMIVRQMSVHPMRPAHPEFDWFKLNSHKGHMLYGSGEQLATFDKEGRGRLYYKSGEIALDYYQAEETNAGQRLVVYSSERDSRGRARPRTVLAVFDYAGNGIVYDHAGKIRLKYNQTEGAVLDRSIGPQTHWTWHNLNDSPPLRTVIIDSQLSYKDPEILKLGMKERTERPVDQTFTNSENYMKSIEVLNAIKESKRLSSRKFKPHKIKMKVVRINDSFSLRILEQSAVHLDFADGKTRVKINIGMVLDPTVILDHEIAAIGEVANSLDRVPTCSESVQQLQNTVRRARARENARETRVRRKFSPHPRSLDKVRGPLSTSLSCRMPVPCL